MSRYYFKEWRMSGCEPWDTRRKRLNEAIRKVNDWIEEGGNKEEAPRLRRFVLRVIDEIGEESDEYLKHLRRLLRRLQVGVGFDGPCPVCGHQEGGHQESEDDE